MSLSRQQNAGQNHDMKIGDRWFENVAQFRYLGTTTTDEADHGSRAVWGMNCLR
jgi:hypothetical protein